MNKNLTVYPISTGTELNIFSNDLISHIRIMDMAGNIVYDKAGENSTQSVIDIKDLASATYIVEVSYENASCNRSVFVKS